MISINGPGGYQQLQFDELKDNKPTKGANYKSDEEGSATSVTVDVHGCGVNYADVCIRWGVYKSAKEMVGWPITPGFEFSGRVAAVGSKVGKFKLGDLVFGVTLFGGYSERILVPENQLFHLPPSFTCSDGAGFLTTALTAWYAIVESCRLRPNDKILVHSAAGGVGSMLVQMGKILQCYVVGVVGSSHKVDYALSIGCDEVIDKSKEDLWQKAREYSGYNGYKAVFDANGVETLKNSYEVTGKAGRLVVYGFHTMLPKSSDNGTGSISLLDWVRVGANYVMTPSFSPLQMVEENKSILGFNLSFMFGATDILHEAMDQMLCWIRDRRLKALKVTEYPLTNAAQAHRDLESGNTTGKLILLSRSAWEQRNEKGNESMC